MLRAAVIKAVAVAVLHCTRGYRDASKGQEHRHSEGGQTVFAHIV
jgi:hypothetical protein